MLMSVECELPAVMMETGAPTPPEVFAHMWRALSGDGWHMDDFGVSRQTANAPAGCIKSEQVITTDTGPTVELAPCPGYTVREIELQITLLRNIVIAQLHQYGVGLLGSGVHPSLGTSVEEYYRFRTQRKAYDYAIEQRGWSHNSIVNICATQEVIDIEFSQAIRVLRVMHRLAGLCLFLFRNDPDLHGNYPDSPYSIRPAAWRAHTPQKGRFAGDVSKVWLPRIEIVSWEHYLVLLWDRSPMFLLGTKNSGLVYVPAHPTFWEYLTNAPKSGWPAKAIMSNKETSVYPEFEHVVQTDWTYMGFARLRWKWKNPLPEINDLVDARTEGRLEEFLAAHIDKVLLEHRANAAALPGQEMTSLAFILGLVNNLEDTEDFVSRYPYPFWLGLAQEAEHQKLSGSISEQSFISLLQEVLEISCRGLLFRGYGEEKYLVPLFRRVEAQTSPSEIVLGTFRDRGIRGVLDLLSYF